MFEFTKDKNGLFQCLGYISYNPHTLLKRVWRDWGWRFPNTNINQVWAICEGKEIAHL